jgi:hypothetical protein
MRRHGEKTAERKRRKAAKQAWRKETGRSDRWAQAAFEADLKAFPSWETNTQRRRRIHDLNAHGRGVLISTWIKPHTQIEIRFGGAWMAPVEGTRVEVRT